jgi:hypothetical protein
MSSSLKRRAPDVLRMRVWERGAGITLACGTGACAAAVAAIERGLTNRKVKLVLDGGELAIEWRESDEHVLMTGPIRFRFRRRGQHSKPGGSAMSGVEIVTFGCRLNAYESEAIRALRREAGLKRCDHQSIPAPLRAKRCGSRVRRSAKRGREHPQAQIIVTGLLPRR